MHQLRFVRSESDHLLLSIREVRLPPLSSVSSRCDRSLEEVPSYAANYRNLLIIKINSKNYLIQNLRNILRVIQKWNGLFERAISRNFKIPLNFDRRSSPVFFSTINLFSDLSSAIFSGILLCCCWFFFYLHLFSTLFFYFFSWNTFFGEIRVRFNLYLSL